MYWVEYTYRVIIRVPYYSNKHLNILNIAQQFPLFKPLFG